MFTLTIHLNEKDNTICIHGAGQQPTDGEKTVAGQIGSAVSDLINEDSLPVKFINDIKTAKAVKPEVTTPGDEDMMSLDDLLEQVNAGK